MSIFDNERGQFAPDQPNQPDPFESVPVLIQTEPIEVDLSRPDRLPAGMSEEITGVPGSKLVADIFTPKKHLALVFVEGPDDARQLVIAGDTKDARVILEPGEYFDASDTENEAKCLVIFGRSRNAVFVRADDPDEGYCIFTHPAAIDTVPDYSECSDDPDYPDEY